MKNFPQQMVHSSGAPLILDTNRLLLVFKKPVAREEIERFVKEIDLSLEEDVQDKVVRSERVNHTTQRFWVQSHQTINDERYQKIEESAAKLSLDWISPVYRLSGEEGRKGLLAPLPNVVLVKMREKRQLEEGESGLHNVIVAAATDGAVPTLKEVVEKTRYLNGYHYLIITNPSDINAYQIKKRLLESSSNVVADVQLETMPMITPTAVSPNDPLFTQQWDMTRIQAGGAGTTAWDISTGVSTEVVCVLDEGCDLTHPDLQFSTPGINLGTMMPDGSPTGNHGTACAGIVAATYNNAIGVAGVAGNSRIMPVAFQNWTDTEVAAGITWASANGARIISMSFGWDPWNHAIIDPAIQNAFNNDVVMCVATHNYNGPITYPATNPLVIAVGASDQIDNRKSPASPDGEGWGSNFGAEISVVAPGVFVPTTDRQGMNGYNNNNGAAITWAGVYHANSGDTAGDYFFWFDGTSAATPHVAGLAALIRSLYPTLTNVQVRAIIERSADKVGVAAYADDPGHPNGTWNQEMGYGRINALRALDFADVIIKDAASDTGLEPFTGGNFWDFSDIVVRITDDGVFVPSDPAQSKNVERGQANYIYVRVTNNGPRDARNVIVSTRITPFVGTQFVYPQDWTLVDAMHVSPASITANFASIPAGGTVIAKFRIEAAQTDTLYGWQNGSGWHPCLLAQVNADNDYAFATAPLTGDPISARRNNLAQRNLSVIDVLASAGASFPFIAGSLYNAERIMSIMIDRSRLPKAMPLLLALDDDGSAFPLVNFETQPSGSENQNKDECCDDGMVFLERTRVKTRLGCCTGTLTLEKGSRFECLKIRKPGKVTVKGGEVVLRGDKRYVEVKESVVTVQIEKSPNSIYPFSLQTKFPATVEKGEQFLIQVAQQNAQGTTVGGAAMVYMVK
ncbi:MAG: S8 family serine peptidase [Chlorobiaceae bacterium]|nr:S8 family serine peptidase [Chlorobiaceae bacterium]NTV17190.1 S8 family serine peptidase [Chlorobiaceae bacterium]